MTWQDWKELFLIMAYILAGAAVFGFIVWRFAKHDEKDRRSREEGQFPSQ